MASQQPSSAAKPLAGFFQATLPILGGRTDSNAANAATQPNHLSTSYAANENPQLVQNTTPDAGPSTSQYSEYHTAHAGPFSGESIHHVTSIEDASTGTQGISGIPYPPSSAGGDGDDEIGSGESEEDDEDTENEEVDEDTEFEEVDEDTEFEEVDEDTEFEEDDDECTENEEDEACNLDDEDDSDKDEEADEKMPVAEEGSPQLDGIDPEMRRTLGTYMKNDLDHIMMCADGKISAIELMKLMARDQAKLLRGMKRSSFEISEDDEIQGRQDWRAKRTKRGDATGECGQPLPWSYGRQILEGWPSSAGEYHRQGALASTSRRSYSRPVGSAVHRLHTDRFRRPAPKATQNGSPKLPSYPERDSSVGGEEYIVNMYTHNAEAQPRPSSYHQHQPGSERMSSALNPAADDNVSNTPFDIHNNHQDHHGSHNSGNQLGPIGLVDGNTQTGSRRAYQQPTASPAQDDPFFSDELYNGMLNGRPDPHHVGSMYTRSQQRAFDNFYQHLMAPRARVEPGSNAQDVMPPPPRFEQEELQTVDVAGLHGRPRVVPGVAATQLHPPYMNSSAPAQGRTALSMEQAASRASQPAEEPDDGLSVGEFADWDKAWMAFVKSHNEKPLLRAHYPDEYR